MTSCFSVRRFLANIFKSSNNQFEFLRFGIVGVIATLIHYGIYLLLLSVAATNVAYSAGFIISFSINFLLSNYFTFKTKPNAIKGFGFFVSHGINFVLHLLLLNFFLWIGIPETIAPAPVFALAVPVNFLMVRYVLKSF